MSLDKKELIPAIQRYMEKANELRSESKPPQVITLSDMTPEYLNAIRDALYDEMDNTSFLRMALDLETEVAQLHRDLGTEQEFLGSQLRTVEELYVSLLGHAYNVEETEFQDFIHRNARIRHTFSSVFRHENLSDMVHAAQRLGLSPHKVFISHDVFSPMMTDNEWARYLKPAPSHKDVLLGLLGSVTVPGHPHYMDLVTDAFRHPQHRVLPEGTVVLIGVRSGNGKVSPPKVNLWIENEALNFEWEIGVTDPGNRQVVLSRNARQLGTDPEI